MSNAPGDHAAHCHRPPGVIRAWPDQDIMQMLIDGELDAAIYGAAMSKDLKLQSVVPDPDAAARAWYALHRLQSLTRPLTVDDL